MKLNHFRKVTAHAQSGQVMLFTLLALGLFLLGAIAFAVDMSALWFQRQTAQTAADAACTAGAMDWLKVQTNNISVAPYPGNFTPGNNFDCNSTTPNSNGSGTTNPAPCVYAALNGYVSSLNQSQAATGTLGDNVYVRFDGAAPPGVASTSVMEVDITQNIPTFFLGLLRGRTTQTVTAIAKCGVQQVASPIPLIVLDPVNPTSKNSAFDIQGNPSVTIYGGPQQSIQINSADAAAVSAGGTALIDLSQGGPANSGSNLGVTGGPITPPTIPTNFNPGTTGQWMSPMAPIQDPLQSTKSPTVTGLNSYPGDTSTAGKGGKLKNPGAFDTAFPPPGGWIANGTGGCSANNAGQCAVFYPGQYPNGICLGSSCAPPGAGASQFAVFQEGLYYVGGTGLNLLSNSCVRMADPATSGPYKGWGGVMFYFSGTATLSVDSNSGNSNSGCDSKELYDTATGNPTGFGVSCDQNSSKHVPPNLPATLTGNVLLAPCTGTWGDPFLATGGTPPSNPGTQRGILFFQDRSAQGVQSAAGGGGTYTMAGTFYFHSCSSNSTDGTDGTGCSVPTVTPPAYYSNVLTMTGNTNGSAYILGEIITDNLALGGGGAIYMDLNPTSAQTILKAALYQ